MNDETHYLEFARAFVCGRIDEARSLGDEARWQAASAAGLRLHKFKRAAALPRVSQVLGALRGLEPTSILDVGSGRGVFLWALLATIPNVAVTAVDRAAQRVADLQAVTRGGITRLAAVCADAEALPFPAASFDVVTVLEVLEHVDNPQRASAEVLRVARRFVVASVPSHPDDNPEHLRLFDADSLTQLFRDAGATRVQVDFVHNHMLATVTV